jgi:hypothetical protein
MGLNTAVGGRKMMMAAWLNVGSWPEGVHSPARPHLCTEERDLALRPYARVYYVDLERDHLDVWRDDLALATWLRLLAVAEAMWPAIPEIPRSADDEAVKRLLRAGLLVSVPPYRYQIKGLDAERSTRSSAARIAAENRWRKEHGLPPLDALAVSKIMPNPAEPSNAKPNQPGRIVEGNFPKLELKS